MKMNNLYQKLANARVDLQEMKLKKSGKNDYSNYSYYELGDFLPAINALCKKYGLFTKFNVISDKGTEKAVLTVLNGEKPEEKTDFVSPTAEVRIGAKWEDGKQTGGADPIQNLGGKITYMRRYMLINAFEIVESDSVDAINKEIAGELPEEEIAKIESAKDFKELAKICGGLKKKYKVEAINPFFESKKVDLEQNTEPVIKKETK